MFRTWVTPLARNIDASLSEYMCTCISARPGNKNRPVPSTMVYRRGAWPASLRLLRRAARLVEGVTWAEVIEPISGPQERNEEALAGLLALFRDHSGCPIGNIPGWVEVRGIEPLASTVRLSSDQEF
jgi:hypothetical protein